MRVFRLALALASGLPLAAGCAARAPEIAAPAPIDSVTLLAQVDTYELEAGALLADLRTSRSADHLRARAEVLVAIAEPILLGYAERDPDCRAYLDAARGMLDRLEEIGLDEVERGFHHDEALPDAPARCYNVKDLLVHAATVIVVLRETGLAQGREQMVAEVAEVLAHLAAVRMLLEESAAD